MSTSLQDKVVRIVEEVPVSAATSQAETAKTNTDITEPIVSNKTERSFHNSASFRQENATVVRAALFPIDPLWIHSEWHVTTGERCIRKRMNCLNPTIKFYSSWFCPFAQRTWITLEECTSIKYKWYEINPYHVNEQNPGGYSKVALSIDEKLAKYPNFVKASPLGLIPALEHTRQLPGENAGNENVRLHDSIICSEYINKVFGKSSLFPTDFYEEAKVRIWCNFAEQRIQKQFYLALSLARATTDDEQKQRLLHMEQFITELRKLAKEMSSDGPYFLGKQFTLFEISFIPFYQRFILLGPYYLKDIFKLPIEEPEFQRLHVWWKAVMTRPSVYNTFVCKERLIASYLDYTQPNKATSNYAQTVLRN